MITCPRGPCEFARTYTASLPRAGSQGPQSCPPAFLFKLLYLWTSPPAPPSSPSLPSYSPPATPTLPSTRPWPTYPRHCATKLCPRCPTLSGTWPKGYWPAKDSTVDEAGWQATLTQIRHDQQRFIDLLENPATDLFKPLPHGDGQNILREALLIGDHGAYHTGEIILIRRLLKAWH
jgi:hypothetical protein